MARGRMVSQSINLDPQFNQMSPDAQLMFLRTVPFLDRDGLVLGNPIALWAKIAPLMTDYQTKMPALIQEWVQVGLAVEYVDRGRDVLWFKGFRKNQTGMRYEREAESEFGPPPGYEYGDEDFVPTTGPEPDKPDCEQTPDELRTNSGGTPAQRARAEVEVKLSGSVRERKQRHTQPSPDELTTAKTSGETAKHRARSKLPRTYPGVDPKLLTSLTNEVKRIRGMPSLIEKPGRDDVEDEMQKLAFDLHGAGYTTPKSLQTLHAEWKQHAQNFSNPTPYPKQLYEFAIQTTGLSKNGNNEPVEIKRVEGDSYL